MRRNRFTKATVPALVFLLLPALVLSLLLSACQPDAPAEPSAASGEPVSAVSDTESTVSDAEPDPSTDPEQEPVRVFTADDLQKSGVLALRTETFKTGGNGIFAQDTAWNESADPYLLPPYFAKDGTCRTALVQAVERTENEGEWKITYCPFRFNEETDAWEQAEDAVSAETYDRNTCNKDGCFVIEYDQKAQTGKPCAYVVVYQEQCEAQPRVLFFNDKAVEYPRILRQNDDYAVLSFVRGEDRSYRVIDKTGATLYTFEDEAALSERTPLTFYGDTLLCKTDTDDDFTYDTLDILHLDTGAVETAAFFGNCGRWMYARDGGWIAAYDGEEGEQTEIHVYGSETKTSTSFTTAYPGDLVLLAGGVLLANRTGENAYCLYGADGTLLASVPGGTEVTATLSDTLFAFGDRRTITLVRTAIAG